MKFNPYPILLTTGALMLATVVFAEAGPTVMPLNAVVTIASVEMPSTDEARHPQMRIGLLDRESAERGGRSRTLEN